VRGMTVAVPGCMDSSRQAGAPLLHGCESHAAAISRRADACSSSKASACGPSADLLASSRRAVVRPIDVRRCGLLCASGWTRERLVRAPGVGGVRPATAQAWRAHEGGRTSSGRRVRRR